MPADPTAVTKLYEQLPLDAMQIAHASYMAWYVDRVTSELDRTMAGLRSELRDNDAKEASYRPSANEVSAIERLQQSGVTGVDLLDRMVEQGEDWLVVTMRRLDHFERTGLAPKDYSAWCEHALAGAYDWIDHDRLNGSVAPASGPARQPAPAASSDWGASRGPSRAEESPTSPVPTMGQRWTDSGYYSAVTPGQPSQGQGSQGTQSQPGQDDDRNRRNVFKIFTN